MAIPNISDVPNTLTILEDGEFKKIITTNYEYSDLFNKLLGFEIRHI